MLYVAGHRPGAGATAVCAALASLWQRQERRVALLKPAALSEAGAADAQLFAAVAGHAGQPEPPPVVTGGTLDPSLADAIAGRVEALARQADEVVVEGLPLTDAQGAPMTASPLLARRLDAAVLGVLPYAPDLTAEVAAPWRQAFGASLKGVLINRRTRYATHHIQDQLLPKFHGSGLPVLGVVPEERLLLAPTVRQIGHHLQAQFYLWPSEDQRLVEHFLIGGLILESGLNYFGRLPNQAVIVQGTRPDIAMAALRWPLSCLVLTGGTEPAQYVYYQADTERVPLMVTKLDTLAAAQALEPVQESVSVHHPQKVERFTQLLADHLDREAAGAAGLP